MMANKQSFRNFPVSNLPRDSMGRGIFLIKIELPIPFTLPSYPEMTSICRKNLIEKSFNSIHLCSIADHNRIVYAH